MTNLEQLRTALVGLLADYEATHGEGVCDCRPEPENTGHICNACLARIALGLEKTEPAPDLRIEPSRGATYANHEYAVYQYDEYPDSSVLAGQTRRQWLAEFDTLAAAQAAYPDAVVSGSGYTPPSLHHLPDESE